MATLNVNGKTIDVEVDDSTPLLWALREQLGCVVPVSSVAASQKITTIEGLSPDGSHPVQRAWAELDVPQCGYCQPGMIMAAAALLADKPNPTDSDIDAGLTNICRCGTFNRVRRGIHRAAELNGKEKS